MSKHERSKLLVTTEADTLAFHAALRVERNRRREPFLAQARALKSAASRAKSPFELLRMSDIRTALTTAAGVADSGAKLLDDFAKHKAVRQFVRQIADQKLNFVDELASRFLVVCDAWLDREMRDAPNQLAQRRLTRSILAHLRNSGLSYRWRSSANGEWSEMSDDEAAIELDLNGLSWTVDGKPRSLVYNLTVPVVRNNVDLCLFDCGADDLTKEMRTNPAVYLALGELKGGIDPAGADEHWKTADSALVRIKSAFAKHKAKPKMFFVGAAVATKTAAEIWAMLKKGDLDNAANLTDDNQLAAITRWLCCL